MKKIKVCGKKKKKKQIEFLATASCNFIMQILSAQCIALALGNPSLWPGAESCGPTASKIRSQVTQFQLSLFHNCIPGVYQKHDMLTRTANTVSQSTTDLLSNKDPHFYQTQSQVRHLGNLEVYIVFYIIFNMQCFNGT